MLLLTTNARDIAINPLDWPRCGRCRMPVENFRAIDTDISIIFVAVCHGSEQVVTVPNELFESMLGSYMDVGYAFQEDKHEH